VKQSAFFDLLQQSNLLEESQLEALIAQVSKESTSLFTCILQENLIEEEVLLKLVSSYINIPFELIDKATLDFRTSLLIPENFAREKHVLPLFQIGNTLTIGISNPFNTHIIEELEGMTDLSINPVITLKENIESLISYCYSYQENIENSDTDNMSSLFELGMKLVEDQDNNSDDENFDLAHEAPIAKLVDSILQQAISEKASDIHIEPEEEHVKIRFRIDGILKDVMSPPKKLESPIISRLKILSNLDITETRKPQDGRMSFSASNKDIDFRVSTVRTISGEKMVMRLLDKSGAFVSLEKLGLSDSNYKTIEALIKNTSGIIIVCGPTGSGKTSTLYSALSKINSPEKNIITIEDPVEFNLDGINQIPANSKIGVDFITALSAVVRQDPDIIMIGEARDFETANIAIQAALTGHLVFTTLHTRSASGSITRLIDMGAKPFLLNSSIVAIIGQRLLRALCPNCKKEIDKETFKGLKQMALIKEMAQLAEKPNFKIYHGTGCKFCDNSGYKGRTGIFELLVPDEKVKELVVNKASAEEIELAAVESGMQTMKVDGLHKVLNGLTTLEELDRVLDM
jgi:type IV pilus assembly protein PilB